MTYYLILEGQITGTIEDPEAFPGRTIVQYDGDHPCSDLYWNGEAIQEKPAQPSPNHFWSQIDLEWAEALPVEPPTIELEPNWAALEDALTGSPLWAKVYRAAGTTLKANVAYTTLLTVVTSTCRNDRLAQTLAQLREAMAGISAIGDFTEAELAEIEQLLIVNNFDVAQFNLQPVLG